MPIKYIGGIGKGGGRVNRDGGVMQERRKEAMKDERGRDRRKRKERRKELI